MLRGATCQYLGVRKVEKNIGSFPRWLEGIYRIVHNGPRCYAFFENPIELFRVEYVFEIFFVKLDVMT